MPTYRSSTPTYLRVACELARLVVADASPATKLPTEAELCRRYRISRQTARRAYQELESEGLVERVPGRGTFPAPRTPYVRSFGSIDDLMALSEDTTMHVVEPLRLTRASVRALTDLGDEEVLRVGVRRLVGDVPFVYTEISLPRRLGAAVESTFLGRRSARRQTTVLELIELLLGDTIVRARQEITVDQLTGPASRHLGLPHGDTVLRIDRCYFDSRGASVESATSWFHPDRYVYRLELRRGRLAR